MKGSIMICPKCKKPVEAKEYFSMGGASDWRVESIGIKIFCSKCKYCGLPVEIKASEYEKLLKNKKR